MAPPVLLQSSDGMKFDPPSYRRETRHIFDSMSRQPLIFFSPLKPISQHLLWNHMSQPASHRKDTNNRLLVIPGSQCAYLSAFGSLDNRISKVLVMNIWAPGGWRIVLVGNWGVNLLAGALSASSDTFATESTKAVLLRFLGFPHPG